jgi:D-beta-D-heptose 7-phosphate kinase/D-beta-D-heptose 1-phosphate adenosyltransferase
VRSAESKIIAKSDMLVERARLREAGRKLVFTNGAFDILHAGHVTYLEFARAQGDALCVGLNSDASVKRYKGDKRPVNTQGDRALVLAALASVDYVVIFDEDEPRELIAEIVPDILVKGADWAHYVSGRDIVESNGGKVILAPLVEGRSTTNMIRRILDVYGPIAPQSQSTSQSLSRSPFPSHPATSFDHERLSCYQLTMELIAWLKSQEWIAAAELANSRSQLEHAALSISLNIAEANEKRESRIRAKYFDNARGSAAECEACLDALVSAGYLADDDVKVGRQLLNRISAALAGLVKRDESDNVMREESEGYGEGVVGGTD